MNQKILKSFVGFLLLFNHLLILLEVPVQLLLITLEQKKDLLRLHLHNFWLVDLDELDDFEIFNLKVEIAEL